MQLGLKLGADVPVFLFGQNAFAQGIGEKLQAYELPEAWYLVLFPPVHVPTEKIFSHPELTRDSVSIIIRALSLQQCRNDMQAVVSSMYPEVADYINELGKFAHARMTGSGACIFAEFENRHQAEFVLQQLPLPMKGVVVQGLLKHPLFDWVPG
jgi:4-diphosphocytidyl-2-C-methyl-D-erythritol kinase